MRIDTEEGDIDLERPTTWFGGDSSLSLHVIMQVSLPDARAVFGVDS